MPSGSPSKSRPRPSAIGCTFLAVGIAYNMAWAHTADRGGACFGRLASVGVRYTGLLLALEYLTHSRSISSHLGGAARTQMEKSLSEGDGREAVCSHRHAFWKNLPP